MPEAREGGRLGALLERMRADPAGDTSLAALARAAGMSRRTFLRRFKANTGTTPAAWLTAARVARARDLLASSPAAIEEIAAAAGFGSAATLRHHFRRQMQVSPADYRRTLRDGRGHMTTSQHDHEPGSAIHGPCVRIIYIMENR